MTEINKILSEVYSDALSFEISESILPSDIKSSVEKIVEKSESFVGVVNVVITSLTYKIYAPSQDVRYHQAKLKNGYSGRTIDTKYIAPFLKSKELKSAKEAGWLTRSLEQPYPYTKEYKGRIRNLEVKESFLNILDYIETRKGEPQEVLTYLIYLLIIQREENQVDIRKLDRHNVSIESIIFLLGRHFEESESYGKSRLPVLAIHNIYTLLTTQLSRYEGKVLQELSSHTSADVRKGDVGDIQINDEGSEAFEAVEVKYGIRIDHNIVLDAYNKFKYTPIKRYYLLSTVNVDIDELKNINDLIRKITDEHGCQVIVNGLLGTIKYYLRLVEDTSEFINLYTDSVLNDKVIKIQHKKLWKELVSEISND